MSIEAAPGNLNAALAIASQNQPNPPFVPQGPQPAPDISSSPDTGADFSQLPAFQKLATLAQILLPKAPAPPITANPTAPQLSSGGASIADILRARGQAPPQVTPAAPPQSRARQIADVVAGGLSDMAAVGQVPAGSGKLGGALTGIGRVLGAREERLDHEQSMRLQNAEANARMLHEQRLLHQLDEQSIQQSIDQGGKMVAAYTDPTLPRPANVLLKDVTSDELQQAVASGRIDPTKQTAFPTGRRVIGEDQDGQPIYRTTYSAITLPDKDLDPSRPEDKKILDLLNKYAPPTEGQWGQSGVQHFAGATLNHLYTTATTRQTAESAARAAALKEGVAEDQLQQAAEYQSVKDDLVNALSRNQNDPWKTLSAMQATKNADGSPKFPNAQRDLATYYDNMAGAGTFKTMLENHDKQVESGNKEFGEFQKKLDSATSTSEVDSLNEGINRRLQNPDITQTEKSTLQAMQTQAAKSREKLRADELQKEQDKANAAANAAANKDASKDARTMGYAVDESGDLKYMSKADADKIHSTFEEIKPSDVNKDRQAIRQLNDVQKNISAYRKAIDSVQGNIDPLAVTNMQAILSDKGVGAKLEPFGVGIDIGMMNDALKGSAVASAWNKLNPQQRDAVIGYLRAKGSVLAYQKALTGVGRTNKEQMEIEMANLPSPYVGATVADEQMKAFQENIDRATEGFPTNLPGIKSAKQVRAEVEAEKAQADAAKQGATHIYDPSSGQVVPITNPALTSQGSATASALEQR